MKILSINRGSSSIKCDLFEWQALPKTFMPPVFHSEIQWKNTGKEAELEKAVEALLTKMPAPDRIGHRIVHGGKLFSAPTYIDAEVKEHLHSLLDLAPLHNLAELQLVNLFEKKCLGVPQYAIFDTAFHHTLPKEAQVYPGPYVWYTQGIQRYGFHGTSFAYCTERMQQLLGRLPTKMVLCHLGSGASLCAVKNGKSIDTTMGFTPLEGLMMDTRCGSIDPGILLYLQKTKTLEELAHTLYFESGLLGLSESSSDMRDILQMSTKGNEKAQLALDVYIHRLTAAIGAMIATLQGVEVIVFTAGIGENAPLIREKACNAFSFLGVKIDLKENQNSKEDRVISAIDSKVQVFVIHAKEAFEIAKQCYLQKK